MKVDRLTPILNVSDLKRTFEWFEKLGWQKAWDWGNPATFGGVPQSQAFCQPSFSNHSKLCLRLETFKIGVRW